MEREFNYFIDYSTANETCYTFYKNIRGPSLSTLLSSKDKFEVKEYERILQNVLIKGIRLLKVLEDSSISHNEIRPSNLILDVSSSP